MPYILIVFFVISIATLYSAADGSFHPWAFKQILRYGIGVMVMLLTLRLPRPFFYAWSYPFYFICLIALILVELMGFVGMGAKRWLHFGSLYVQPSEFMRIAVILALARYFGDFKHQITQMRTLVVPAFMVMIPVLLIAKQPDLGTALLIMGSSLFMALSSGIQLWKFGAAFLTLGGLSPILWKFLHEYQKKRILVFLFPETDIQNAGYHVMQSKIAIGSSGLFGKGFMQSTQARLQFLPEKQTDFIFAMIVEEWGSIAAVVLIVLYLWIIVWGLNRADRLKNRFEMFTVCGLISSIFVYAFVNMGMCMGILPIVGIPLPFLSYGGTSLLSLFLSLGIVYRFHLPKVRRFV
ncbi:MAG: rod shape-determining protein RodA [Alphaproteobacteria bacterium]|nr:MAG: rod shape-determining protein RodA [Alphaproteobacteria bacterium]